MKRVNRSELSIKGEAICSITGKKCNKRNICKKCQINIDYKKGIIKKFNDLKEDENLIEDEE